MKGESKIASNIWKLYLCSVFKDMIFFVPILVPFLMGVGLSMKEILLVEGAFSVAVLVLEIPSGYFADIYGRKRSMILGAFFFMLSMIMFSFADSFFGFIVAELLGGTGVSFYSGANEALLYDSLLEMKQEKTYKKLRGSLFFFERMASVFSHIVGGLLAVFFLRLPFIVSIVPAFLWMVFTMFLVEPKGHESRNEKWGHFVKILKESFLEHPKLRWFILYTAAPAGLSLTVFWLFQGYMEYVSLPIVYFGLVIGAMNIFSGFAAKYAHIIEEKIGLKWSLIMVPVLFCMAWIPMVFIAEQWALIFIFLSAIAWGFSNPIFSDFIQQKVSSDRRATIMSVQSLFGRMVFVVVAPFVGYFVDLYNVQTAILVSVLLMATASAVTLFMLKRVKVF